MSKAGAWTDLPQGVRLELDPIRHRVVVLQGSKHLKVLIDGHLVLVTSRARRGTPRQENNAAATIRRWLRGLLQ